MAIIKRRTKHGWSYQVKVEGSDGKCISETFNTKREAERRNEELKRQKYGGSFVSNVIRQLTLDEYFAIWDRDTKGTKSAPAWRESQIQMYQDYVQPIIGNVRLHVITPAFVLQVLQGAKLAGLASQSVRHVYNLLHKVFRDAVETHQFLERSPVRRNDKPNIEEKEADFLELADIKRLLAHVEGKPYEVAIWLGVYVGLRVGEVQALIWDNIDFTNGILHVRRTYVRREQCFKEYPKGKRWHDIAIPLELLAILNREKAKAKSEYVATGPDAPQVSYESYLRILKRYCNELGLKDLGTHNLRHSTAGLWMAFGASKSDIGMLFAHSSQKVTERYIHFQTAKHLGKIANGIQLFPKQEIVDKNGSDQILPKSSLEEVDAVKEAC
ncbi:site-specific integrase [Bdellovibrionota bacterium FG-2]